MASTQDNTEELIQSVASGLYIGSGKTKIFFELTKAAAIINKTGQAANVKRLFNESFPGHWDKAANYLTFAYLASNVLDEDGVSKEDARQIASLGVAF
jgi:hypothetical protein